MKQERTSTFGFVNSRLLLAFALCSAGLLLAVSSFTGMGWHSVARPDDSKERNERSDPDRRERYMPVPEGEADDLDGLEVDWHNRLTYPTGRFDPTWVRTAAVQDAAIARGVPFGLQSFDSSNPAALASDSFTALGPQPLRMTGCSGCFNYNLTEGRVNDIVVDPDHNQRRLS